jgi:hypothetical protein
MYGGPYGAGGMPGYGGPGTYSVSTYSAAPSFTVPPLPQVPDVSHGVGEGPAPYGTAFPSGPSGYPCTMPGCR